MCQWLQANPHTPQTGHHTQYVAMSTDRSRMVVKRMPEDQSAAKPEVLNARWRVGDSRCHDDTLYNVQRVLCVIMYSILEL